MKSNRFLVGATAAAMALTSVSATAGVRASDVASVSVQPVALSSVTRASASSERKSELGGSGLVVALLAAAAVIAGVVIAADDDDDSDLSPGA